MPGTAPSQMFPKLSVCWGDWNEAARRGSKARAGRVLGVTDGECGFCPHVSGGPVGGTEAELRQ